MAIQSKCRNQHACKPISQDQSLKVKKDRREYMRQLYARNLEHFRETCRKRQAEWREKNPEKARVQYKQQNDSQKGIDRRERFRKKHPAAAYDANRKFALKRRYNITPEQWNLMFAAQGSACANRACRTVHPGKAGWHTDHCHETGRLRAILCKSCNLALGTVKDDPAVLRGLADYLDTHKARSDGPACLTFPAGWKKRTSARDTNVELETQTCLPL